MDTRFGSGRAARLRRPPPAAVRADGGGRQHRFRHSGLSRHRGRMERKPPMTLQMFMGGDLARARYWARSMIGWRRFGRVLPNDSHRALARLESRGRLSLLVTQNVDGLHEAAGSREVVDLHGRLDQVRCMRCDWRGGRQAWQDELAGLNPHWESLEASDAPGRRRRSGWRGFLRLPRSTLSALWRRDQARCGLFGETVPRERVDRVNAGLMAADAVLVVGSSLMVYSGYRFVAAAAQRHADRGDQSGPHARRRLADPEGGTTLRAGAGCPVKAPAGRQSAAGFERFIQALVLQGFSAVTELSIGLSTDSGDNS